MGNQVIYALEKSKCGEIMFFDQIGKILWSDNWYLEEEKAYICAANYAAIFCVDLSTLQCNFLSQIPDRRFMENCQNSYCIKYQDTLFCFSYDEKNICCYNFEKRTWEKIEIGYQDRLMICLDTVRTDHEKIWMVEVFGRKVYQFNCGRKKVEKEFRLPVDKNVFTGQYVMIRNRLYCVARNEIHCIDLENGNMVTYEVLVEKGELFTICYDGFNFWLSGCCEAIYVWNPQCGVVRVIKGFVENTNGICTESNIIQKNAVMFIDTIPLGEYIWHIPLQCNAPVLYINKRNYKVGVLDIKEEWETEESIAKRGSSFKYMVEYIRQNRYIGIISCKNQILFEIDTVNLCIKRRECVFSKETIQILARKIYKEKKILMEYKNEQEFFSILLDSSIENKEYGISNVGASIYSELLK